MRFNEIICEDRNDDIKQSVLDLISVSSAEGMNSLSIDTIIASLDDMGMNVDHEMLFHLLDTLPIVNNIKDDIAYFGHDTETDSAPFKDQQANKIDKMARKQTGKGLKKSKKTDFKPDFSKDF